MNPESMVAGVTESGVGAGGIPGFTFSHAFGFFNVIVGLMIVAAFIFFFGGLAGYLARLGLENRTDGLMAMYWGVTILFVLVVVLGIVHYLQFNPGVVFTIIGILIVGLIGWAVVNAVWEGGGDEKAKH
jgi:hypothetical protein